MDIGTRSRLGSRAPPTLCWSRTQNSIRHVTKTTDDCHFFKKPIMKTVRGSFLTERNQSVSFFSASDYIFFYKTTNCSFKQNILSSLSRDLKNRICYTIKRLWSTNTVFHNHSLHTSSWRGQITQTTSNYNSYQWLLNKVSSAMKCFI